MMNAKTNESKTNQTLKWLVDVILFSGFILAFLLDFTGLELHQWIGVFAGILAGYHLITHWNWVISVTRRFFGKTSGRVRLYYLLDASILTGFFVITFTGLAISSWFNLAVSIAAWREVHILASIVTLILIVLKIGMHWRWVAGVLKKLVSSAPAAPVGNAIAAVHAVGKGQTSRREFLHVMGLVSVASVFAISSAADSLGLPVSELAIDGTQPQLDNSLTSNLTGSSQSCSIQCGRRCVFPGHCPRYTDTNGNNICDNGECA